MKFMKIVIPIYLLLMMVEARALNFMQINISYQYDPLAEVQLRNRAIQSGDNMVVFLKFRSDSIANWSMEFMVQNGYEDENHKTLLVSRIDSLVVEQTQLILKLNFRKPQETLMVVKIFREDKGYYYDINLTSGSFHLPTIYPVDKSNIPIFENYINTSAYSWKGDSGFYAMEYQENFPFADPPMAEMEPLAPSVAANRSFTFSDSVHLLDDHFYVIRSNESDPSGVTIFKSSTYYPEFKLLSELSYAMQYIMNEPEREEMRSTGNLRKTFDVFWINTYKTKFRARNAIRNYFNWIQQANYIFTDFKQGWKTDRGMLFIIYGVPDEVYRTDNNEEWYYDSGPAFEFTIISTFFAPRTYALRRRKDFEELWLEYITAIRRGQHE